MIKKKEKLVYVLHEIALGGAEVAFLSALPFLYQQFDLRVFILHKGDQKLIDAIPKEVRACIVFCNAPLTLYPFYLISVVVRILRLKPRYLICSLWRAYLIGSCVKWLYKEVTYYPFIHNSTFFHRFDSFSSQYALKIADMVLVDSKSAQEFITNTCQVDKPVSIVSFITNLTPVTIPVYDYKQVRFIYIGRLHPIKNVPKAVEAVAWFHRHGVTAYFDIYGRDDGDMANVKKAIDENHMQPYVQLKGELIPAMKEVVMNERTYPYYLQLSSKEGMAMSVVEAMQAGKVCVVAPVGEIPNYAENSQSAIFVDTSTPECWEHSMQQVLEIISDETYCRRISESAHDVFRDRPLFKDSLVEVISSGGERNA